MTAEDITCWRNLGIVVGIVVTLQLLCLVACREVVKSDLRERGCEPSSIRLLWWRALLSARVGVPWRVVYSDSSGGMHCAVCRVRWNRRTTWEAEGTRGYRQ